MTDVLKLALERREALQQEVKKLDDFIRMAETLMSGDHEVEPVQSSRTAAQLRQSQAAAAMDDTVVRTALRRAGESSLADDPEAQQRPSIIRRSAT